MSQLSENPQGRFKSSNVSQAGVNVSQSQGSMRTLKNQRTASCSSILTKNGMQVAVAFRSSPRHHDFVSNRSLEKDSLSHIMYTPKQELHVGIAKKPLQPYNPDAYRNRLYQPTFVQKYGNSSQLTLGDRTSVSKRHFLSTSQNMLAPANFKLGYNSGIVSDKTKWLKYLQSK